MLDEHARSDDSYGISDEGFRFLRPVPHTVSQELARIWTIEEINEREEGSREWMEGVNTTMHFRPGPEIGISCGTVTFDIERKHVLTIQHKKLKLYMLPKGRRNINETFWDAALRETREETGNLVDLCNLLTPTRATSTNPNKPQIVVDEWNKEFIGACSYPDPQSKTPAFKTVYLYAAVGDSSAAPRAQPKAEKTKTVGKWIPLEDVEKKVYFRAERDAIWKAKEIFENSGAKFGEKWVQPRKVKGTLLRILLSQLITLLLKVSLLRNGVSGNGKSSNGTSERKA